MESPYVDTFSVQYLLQSNSFYHTAMCPKDTDGTANSVDHDQTKLAQNWTITLGMI